MTSFSPTSEQQAVLDAFESGANMVVEAGAGTGKTTTLAMLAQNTTRQGLYIVYNKKAKKDAEEKFAGSTTEPLTAHSVAYRALRSTGQGSLLNRLKGPKVYSKELVGFLGCRPYVEQTPDGEKVIPPWVVARSAVEAIKRFCQSADDEIKAYHVPAIDGLTNQKGYKEFVISFAEKGWADLQKNNGTLKFEHDHYLKIWALSKPELSYEFILLDEAQDTNPVLERVIAEQKIQKVMVGDRCQALYEWRGAVDAMSNFKTDQHLLLQQSFRFGHAVAEIANLFLGQLDTPMRLKGLDSIPSVVVEAHSMTEPDAILCRTNAAAIEYAMDYQGKGKKVAIVGGTGEIEYFTKNAILLKGGKSASHPDLVAFDSWNEVVQHSETGEGEDLKVRVQLIQKYGCDDILKVCEASVEEKNADIVVSTGHKAKGAEWNKVLIGSDFKAPTLDKPITPAELRLAYVAATRAKLELDLGGLAWILDPEASWMTVTTEADALAEAIQ